jgi:hypothetical protein
LAARLAGSQQDQPNAKEATNQAKDELQETIHPGLPG